MGEPISLEVEFAGVKMRAPFGVAPQAPFSPPSIAAEPMADLLLKHVESGAGFVHTPYTNTEPSHPKTKLPTGRFMRVHTKRFGTEGMWCTADTYRIEMRLDACLKLIDIVKKRLPPDVPVIANIIGPGADPEGWAEHAARFEAAGADLIELDVSCPLPASEAKAVDAFIGEKIPEHAGVLLGDMPALTAEVTRMCVRRCRVPVGVKFSPEVGFPRLVAFVEQLKDVGAKFVTSINAPLSVAAPDIYNGGRSLYPGLDANPISPALGPWTRYLCYRNIGTISMFVPGVDQAAVGGLVEPKHAVEAMMLGAKVVEFSSGTLWKGWNYLNAARTFLLKYMAEQGYRSLADFRGLGVQYIKPVEAIDWGVGRLVAKIDLDECTGCGICVDNLCWATYLEGKKAKVKEEYCGACALCIAVCPANAVTIGEAVTPRSEEEIWEMVTNAPYTPKWL